MRPSFDWLPEPQEPRPWGEDEDVTKPYDLGSLLAALDASELEEAP